MSAVALFGSQNEMSGAFILNPDAIEPPEHCALISTPENLEVALNVRSTG